MKRSTVLAAIALFAGLGVVGGGLAFYKARAIRAASQQPAFEPAEAVDIVEAKTLDWGPTAELVGTVVAIRSVNVQNELAGVITGVGFQSGAEVAQGQVILTLDDRLDRADLAAAEASVRVAEAAVPMIDSRLALAQQELDRLTAMNGSRAVAEVELDRARSTLTTARAERARALAEIDQYRARVAQVNARLDKLRITSPFRARAGLRQVHEGQYLAEGAQVVTLHELTDTIYLDFAIPQEYAPRVRPGTAVMATGELLGPEPQRIEVVASDATVNNSTRNLRVRAVVDNRRGSLVPGMFIQIRVPVEEPTPRVVVPGTAVRRASYADAVFVVEPGQKEGELRARQRFVKLGPAVGDQVIVLEGVKPGDKLASSGSFKLREGALIMPKPPGAPPDPAAPPGAAATAQPSKPADPTTSG